MESTQLYGIILCNMNRVIPSDVYGFKLKFIYTMILYNMYGFDTQFIGYAPLQYVWHQYKIFMLSLFSLLLTPMHIIYGIHSQSSAIKYSFSTFIYEQYWDSNIHRVGIIVPMHLPYKVMQEHSSEEVTNGKCSYFILFFQTERKTL